METLLNTLMQQLISSNQSNDFTIKERWNELYSIYTSPQNINSKIQDVNDYLDRLKSENSDIQLQQTVKMVQQYISADSIKPDYRIQTQYSKKSESYNEFNQSTDRLATQGSYQNFGAKSNNINEQQTKIYNSGLLKVEIRSLLKQMESGTQEIEKMINE